jgi:hypothetical protein
MKRLIGLSACTAILAGFVYANTCLNQTAATGPCFSGTPPDPELVNDGWTCSVETIQKLYVQPGSCIGKSGREWNTRATCDITWICYRLEELMREVTTSPAINTNYKHWMLGSCICP